MTDLIDSCIVGQPDSLESEQLKCHCLGSMLSLAVFLTAACFSRRSVSLRTKQRLPHGCLCFHVVQRLSLPLYLYLLSCSEWFPWWQLCTVEMVQGWIHTISPECTRILTEAMLLHMQCRNRTHMSSRTQTHVGCLWAILSFCSTQCMHLHSPCLFIHLFYCLWSQTQMVVYDNTWHCG